MCVWENKMLTHTFPSDTVIYNTIQSNFQHQQEHLIGLYYQAEKYPANIMLRRKLFAFPQTKIFYFIWCKTVSKWHSFNKLQTSNNGCMNIVFVNMRLHFLIISIIKTIMIISPGTTTQSFSCIIRVDDGESLVTDQWVGTGALVSDYSSYAG